MGAREDHGGGSQRIPERRRDYRWWKAVGRGGAAARGTAVRGTAVRGTAARGTATVRATHGHRISLISKFPRIGITAIIGVVTPVADINGALTG